MRIFQVSFDSLVPVGLAIPALKREISFKKSFLTSHYINRLSSEASFASEIELSTALRGIRIENIRSISHIHLRGPLFYFRSEPESSFMFINQQH